MEPGDTMTTDETTQRNAAAWKALHQAATEGGDWRAAVAWLEVYDPPQRRRATSDILLRAEAYKLHAEALNALGQAMTTTDTDGSKMARLRLQITDSALAIGGGTEDLRKELEDALKDLDEAREIAQGWKDRAVEIGHDDDGPMPWWMK